MTKKEILDYIGLKYNEKKVSRINKEWLEKALDLYNTTEDKETCRKFLQQFIRQK